MKRHTVCASKSVVQFLLLQRLELGLELVLKLAVSVASATARLKDCVLTSSTMLPIPTGFEIASEISLVRSICSRMLSIVWSTFSTLLRYEPCPRMVLKRGMHIQTRVDTFEGIGTFLHGHHGLGVEVCRFYRIDLVACQHHFPIPIQQRSRIAHSLASRA